MFAPFEMQLNSSLQMRFENGLVVVITFPEQQNQKSESLKSQLASFILNISVYVEIKIYDLEGKDLTDQIVSDYSKYRYITPDLLPEILNLTKNLYQ